jgi:hypothetical protein
MIAQLIGERNQRAVLGLVIPGTGNPKQQRIYPIALVKQRMPCVNKVMLDHYALRLSNP